MPNYINVPVPEHLVPAVMKLIASEMGEGVKPVAPIPDNAPVTVSNDWTEAELRKLWLDSEPKMRQVLDKFSQSGGVPVTGDELAKVIGKEKKGHSIAGMMGAIGRRIKHRHKGRWPFSKNWNAEAYRWEYTMTAEIAALLQKAKQPAAKG